MYRRETAVDESRKEAADRVVARYQRGRPLITCLSGMLLLILVPPTTK